MFLARSFGKYVSSNRTLMTGCRCLQQATELKIPTPDGQPAIYSDKIENLVTQISALNLIEVSELTSALKQRLNLPDAPIFAAPSTGMAADKKEDDEEAAPKQVQTIFTVKLMKFDEKQKVALIKECKNLLEGMNLVQAKKFVESCPTVVKTDIPKEEAEKLKEALTKVGAEIVID